MDAKKRNERVSLTFGNLQWAVNDLVSRLVHRFEIKSQLDATVVVEEAEPNFPLQFDIRENFPEAPRDRIIREAWLSFTGCRVEDCCNMRDHFEYCVSWAMEQLEEQALEESSKRLSEVDT